MTKIRFIGDIHGKMLHYLSTIDGIEDSIQVGDFGVGFGTVGAPDYIDKQISEIPGNHRFIRGNHDHPKDCTRSKYWIKDGTIEDNMMLVGGAYSIDREYRIDGISWWRDEELSYEELNGLISLYSFMQPEIMVTHTAPISIPRDYMGFRIFGQGSRTELAFDQMLSIRRPKLWILGHWHKDFDETIDGTRFICLNELSYIDIDTDDYK